MVGNFYKYGLGRIKVLKKQDKGYLCKLIVNGASTTVVYTRGWLNAQNLICNVS